jgi:hypothetical protein
MVMWLLSRPQSRTASLGTAANFEEASVGFETDWKALLPEIPEGAFEEWRDQRDWTEGKYASWARGERLPSQIPSSMMMCPCGERFDSHDPERSYVHRQHIYARYRNNEIRRPERLH